MDELLDIMYARAIAKFKANSVDNVLEPSNLTKVHLPALPHTTVENISADTPANINLPAQSCTVLGESSTTSKP